MSASHLNAVEFLAPGVSPAKRDGPWIARFPDGRTKTGYQTRRQAAGAIDEWTLSVGPGATAPTILDENGVPCEDRYPPRTSRVPGVEWVQIDVPSPRPAKWVKRIANWKWRATDGAFSRVKASVEAHQLRLNAASAAAAALAAAAAAAAAVRVTGAPGA